MESYSHSLNTGDRALRDYPFKSVGSALRFLNTCNPARQRFPNLAEPEFGHRPGGDDFSGESPRDLWASVAAAVDQTLKDQPREWRVAWVLRNRGDSQGHLSVEEISDRLSLPIKVLYRILKTIADELEDELIARELLEPRSDNYD